MQSSSPPPWLASDDGDASSSSDVVEGATEKYLWELATTIHRPRQRLPEPRTNRSRRGNDPWWYTNLISQNHTKGWLRFLQIVPNRNNPSAISITISAIGSSDKTRTAPSSHRYRRLRQSTWIIQRDPLLGRVGLLLLLLLLSPWTTTASWVDPDTPARRTYTHALTPTDTRSYTLVFSDEFEVDGRNFRDGNDPRWTAIHKNDYTNSALHFYSHNNANTTNGVLNITTESRRNEYKAYDEDKKKFYVDEKYIQTGMVQSWNKFCFLGGIVEFSAKLPGDPEVGGLWPALWMLGNLARATYVGSSNFMWPYSYNRCDVENRMSQEISACSRVNHYNLQPFRGRGAPEIDVIEAMQGEKGKLPNTFIQRPYQSASLQVAPGVETKRPLLGHRPRPGHWYTDLKYGNETIVDLNPFFYGVTLVHKPKSRTYQADAISANMQLNDTHYQDQHIYRVEWDPPNDDGEGGYVRWYTDGHFVFGIAADSLNITGTEIPSEPMYLIMNTAVSSHWGFPAPCPDGCDCECYECGNPECTCGMPDGFCDNIPASFEIDYVRVYQAVDEPKHILGCSPEKRPSATFIEGHKARYTTETQNEPLLPVANGGALCSADADCGGSMKGLCGSDGTCVCGQFFTGPRCLSHRAFYDVDTSAPIPPFYTYNVYVPHSLVILATVIVASFCFVVIVSVERRKREPHYAPLFVNSNSRDKNGHDRRESMAYRSNGGTSSVQQPPPPQQQQMQPSRYQGSSLSSYQHQYPLLPDPTEMSDSYAIPTNHKDVTYCMIDQRLVDS